MGKLRPRERTILSRGSLQVWHCMTGASLASCPIGCPQKEGGRELEAQVVGGKMASGMLTRSGKSLPGGRNSLSQFLWSGEVWGCLRPLSIQETPLRIPLPLPRVWALPLLLPALSQPSHHLSPVPSTCPPFPEPADPLLLCHCPGFCPQAQELA